MVLFVNIESFPQYNPHTHHFKFIVSDLEEEEDSVKIEVFHYVYFGDNKSLGYVTTTTTTINTHAHTINSHTQ